jgi:demethylmenaquinone methyltransferase/2-methoxy-6-polyprenyl-1,4-benzoquinol methylase
VAGRRALDLGTGTGDIALALASSGARVTGLDFAPPMVALARRKTRERSGSCSFVVADMASVPFQDRSFDVVTTGYGLRNVSNLDAALDEIARVLVPGGLALSLDFERPANRLVRRAYLLYLTIVGSALGWILHRDPDTYRYIAASIRRYPGADALRRSMEARGFTDVRCLPVFGGLLAIHSARRLAHRSA